MEMCHAVEYLHRKKHPLFCYNFDQKTEKISPAQIKLFFVMVSFSKIEQVSSGLSTINATRKWEKCHRTWTVLEKTSHYKKVLFAHGLFFEHNNTNYRKKRFWCMYPIIGERNRIHAHTTLPPSSFNILTPTCDFLLHILSIPNFLIAVQ